MSWPAPNLSALPYGGASVADDLRAQLEHTLTTGLEEQLLRAGPDTFRAAGLDNAASDHGRRFVDFETESRRPSRNID